MLSHLLVYTTDLFGVDGRAVLTIGMPWRVAWRTRSCFRVDIRQSLTNLVYIGLSLKTL